jgi:hypothetical protein
MSGLHFRNPELNNVCATKLLISGSEQSVHHNLCLVIIWGHTNYGSINEASENKGGSGIDQSVCRSLFFSTLEVRLQFES